jgi:hypothetical protein
MKSGLEWGEEGFEWTESTLDERRQISNRKNHDPRRD